jgi:GTP-binding protein
MRESDVVMFVVDATVGALDEDDIIIRTLRKAQVPVVLVANKVDDARTETDAAALWNMGLGQPWPVSGLHGRGSGDMLDALIAALPDEGRDASRRGGPRRIALVGRPNVGKSSLLNALAGDVRVVVHDVAGTTVDPVDEVVELDGRQWVLVDTAGIRRKVDQASGHEWYASLRTHGALEKSEIALVVLDASDTIAEQDVRIVTMAVESGRAVVVVYNKWDLVDEERQHYLERERERDLHMIAWAPRINISAKTTWHVNRLVPAMDTAWNGWNTRVPTHQLNRFIKELVAAHPHPVRGGKQSKILFVTQVGVCPPVFVLFTTGVIEAGYRRFVERRLREEFGFAGSPIRLLVRVRERQRR